MRTTHITLLALFAVAGFGFYQPSHASNNPVILASSSATEGRFMALNRSAKPYVKVRRVAGTRRSGLHSDTQQLGNGFLRVDRTMLVVNKTAKARAQEAAPQPEQHAGLLKPESVLSNDPILDLFGADGAEASAQFGVTQRGSGSAARGYMWPVSTQASQRVSSGFGTRKDPFTGKPAFHGGIDIAAAIGTPVLAAASGTVQDVGTSKRYGKFVSVQHADGKVSWYGHLSDQSVQKGAPVRQGEMIGRIGSTGRSTGPHLDFRIKDGDRFVNPSQLIGTGPSSMQVAQTSLTR